MHYSKRGEDSFVTSFDLLFSGWTLTITSIPIPMLQKYMQNKYLQAYFIFLNVTGIYKSIQQF
jgi:hypothetical protein